MTRIESNNHLVELHPSIIPDEVRAVWDRMAPPDSGLLSGFLLPIELSSPGDLSFHYGIIYTKESRGVAGIVYFQELEFGSRNFKNGRSTPIGIALKALFTIKRVRLLIVGNLMAAGSKPCVRDNGKITDVELLSLIRSAFRQIKADVMVLKDMPEGIPDELFKSMEMETFPTDMTMSLRIREEWKSMADYVQSLKKKYAKRFRKIRSSGANLERRTLLLDELIRHRERIRELFLNVSNRQTIRLGRVDERYLIEMKRSLGDLFEIVGYFNEGQLAGFATYIQHGTELEIHYIGMDYKVNSSHHLYFNILFDAVEKAFHYSAKTLEMGRTARIAKAITGAEPIYFRDYYYTKSTFIKSVIRRFQSSFQNEMGESWRERSPFKSIQETA